jgi:hypothetical protein
MKKLIGISFLAVGLLFLSGRSEAVQPARGAKQTTTIIGSTIVIGVSSGTAVVYAVTLGTGTAGTDFVTLFDSATVSGLAAGSQSTSYKMRLNVSSATQNTFYVFDPPLQFNNGIMAVNSAGTLTSMITYERGRVTQGY